MMKRTLIPLIAMALVLPACGNKKAAQPKAQPPAAAPSHESSGAMPKDAIHGAMGGAMAPMNTRVVLSDAIRKAWTGIKVKVVDIKSGKASTYDVPFGTAKPLGDTGLVLTAENFIPDFVMAADGITSRSAEPKNPAAHVVISEEGKPDFKGWLFAAMPDIHPFAHEKYRVLLVAGIPAK